VPVSSYCDTYVDIWSLQVVVVVAAAAAVVVVVDDVVIVVGFVFVGFVAVAASFFLLFLSFLDYKQI
jgi:hypothetical protein